MSYIMALSIPTAVLCGVWSLITPSLGLIGWAGFAGCTTYFASGSHGIQGAKTTLFTNLSGVFWAMMIIILSNKFHFLGSAAVFTGIITFIMCIQSKIKYFSFIPGTFLGCFSTFAGNGNWKMVALSLLLGAFLGIACEWSGNITYSKFGADKEDS
ncbi:DUF1097 domain-containing protein [Clostridium botulinum]|nr:DUF1097 domain-containing protein [Clostridium botulinum]NFL03150.1 DUF1097 domain-containing protein [Clostridium botulinum]